MKGTIRQHRVFLELTQADMAERLGVSRQTYNAWEAEPENLSFRTGLSIAKALGVDFNDIIFIPEQTTKC